MTKPYSDTIVSTGVDQTILLPDSYENITIKAEDETWFNLSGKPAVASAGSGNFKLEAGSSWTGQNIKDGIDAIRFISVNPSKLVSAIAWCFMAFILVANPVLAQYTPPGSQPVSGNQTLNSGHVWVGNGSNKATDTAVTGDVSITNTGATTVTTTNGTAFTSAATGNASGLNSGTVPAAQMPALTGDVTSSAGSTATTLPTVNSNVGSFTNANVTVNAKGQVTAASSGATPGNVSFGGNGSDGAVSLSSASTDTRVYNATTFTISSGISSCPGCLINATGVVTVTATLTAGNGQAGTTSFGMATPGGAGATAATSAGQNGGGLAYGQAGNSGASIGAGGGAGAAGSGGNGGGATIASGTGEGGLNGAGTSHFGGNLNGSGGGGGGSGASGTGGNGGAGASHLTIITAGGFSGTGNLRANGGSGGNGATLGSGGGGGGAGTVQLFSSSGNLPGMTVQAVGGGGGSSVSTAANPGGGGGGYICGTVSGTTVSLGTNVNGGGAGTGGSGTAGAAGGNGLVNIIASTTPTLPNISFNNLNDNAAGKNMCWVLLARRAAIYHQENESEASHKFIWDGERHQEMAPISFIASTYAAPGKFAELQTALLNGGEKDTANLCDATNREQCKHVFDTFKDSPIRGAYPLLPETCTDPNEHGYFCGEFPNDRT